MEEDQNFFIDLRKIGFKYVYDGNGIVLRLAKKVDIGEKEDGINYIKLYFITNDLVEEAYNIKKEELVQGIFIIRIFPEYMLQRLESPLNDTDYYDLLCDLSGNPTQRTRRHKLLLFQIHEQQEVINQLQETVAMKDLEISVKDRRNAEWAKEQVNVIEPWKDLIGNKIIQKDTKREQII